MTVANSDSACDVLINFVVLFVCIYHRPLYSILQAASAWTKDCIVLLIVQKILLCKWNFNCARLTSLYLTHYSNPLFSFLLIPYCRFVYAWRKMPRDVYCNCAWYLWAS